MKNWSDDGKVNYDAGTNQNYATVKLYFDHLGERRKFDLKIPLQIRAALKTEHLDAAVQIGKKALDAAVLRLISNGCFHLPSINKTANMIAHLAICEHLYNEFTIEQAKRGNQVWATPEGMQKVGPKPEEDLKFLM
jgi:hypothetical protein